MAVRNTFYFFIGFVFAVSVSSSFALTSVERNIIKDEQEILKKNTGMYVPQYDGPIKVFTYETICKGFYTVEDNGVEVTYTGFGPLADQYTFKEKSYKVDSTKQSTTTVNEKVSTSTPIVPVL